MAVSGYQSELSFALEKDRLDPLKHFRDEFYFPRLGGKDAVYFCGNSLGIQPKRVEAAIQQELDDWRKLGVLGYHEAKNPWLYYQHQFQKSLSRLAGCYDHEVTVMNTLTINLHLMLLSFFKPSGKKNKILMEAGAFPSDQYAVETLMKIHGLDPENSIIELSPRKGEKTLAEEDILDCINRNRDELALVLLGGINYYSGQLFDIKGITQAAHAAGAIAGFDLAHAIGNVELSLHEWDVDFAVWCSYKYLNGGPGAVGGAFIHERYATDRNRSRLGGWWGNDEKTRFLMEKGFIPKPDANGWNISTAQVFNMVALKASLEIFDRTSMKELRRKSVDLTGYLEFMVQSLSSLHLQIITPKDAWKRGAQLSLYFPERGKQIFERMIQEGIIVDFREPGVIRVAPTPLYNSFEEVHRFHEILLGFA
jgi:kynureninase